MKNLRSVLNLLISFIIVISFVSCSSSNKSSNTTKPKTYNYIEPKELNIDWNTFDEGDYPKNYGGLTVYIQDGNKILSTPAEGKYSFEIKNPFPLDFRLLITMSGNTSNSGDHIASVTLMSPNGDLSYWIMPHPVGGGLWELGFYDSQIRGKIKADNNVLTDIEIKKKGDVYKLYLANNMICSYQNDNFYQFTGLRISVTCYGKLKYGYSFSKISLTSM